MGFGKQLQEVLDELNMNVASLSRETGIPATTIYSIIKKDIDNVGLDKVKKIEKAIRAVPGGNIYNLLYGIKPEESIISTRQSDYYAIGAEHREYWVNENYNSLNEKGQVKAAEYIEDLTKIPEYRRENDFGQTEEVIAAHARTDIAKSEEGQEHDMGIMDDDDEWE